MPLYIQCDTCMKIWAPYGRAVSAIRLASPGTDENKLHGALREAEQAIATHGAIAHPKLSSVCSGAPCSPGLPSVI